MPDHEYLVTLGKADVKMEGDDVTVFTYGLMLHHCLEAARQVAREGISVEIVDLRSIRPLDNETILSSAKKTGKVLIVHEDTKALGVGAEVSAIISEQAFEHLDSPIKRVAGPEVPAMPFSPSLEDVFMPDSDRIVTAIQELAVY